MKKISSALKNNHEFIARPFALVGHDHPEYIPVDANYPVDISTNLNFTGTITGLTPDQETITAGENISALRILTTDSNGLAIYADPLNADHVRKLLGMSTSAGLINEPVVIRLEGKYQDSGWSWDPNEKLYLGANGTLTQVAPVTGNLVVLGHAIKSDTIHLNFETPIALI